jgi:DNA mismatch repair protein MutS
MTPAKVKTSSTVHTPLIQQYLDVKARHPDSLLFFRVGDFYEMFFEDAEEGSGLLGLTLTSRNNGGKRDVPLAGIPVKAVTGYVSRLLKAGRRVAICEQLENPADADGIVRRDVVEVITPGTVIEDSLLTDKRNNYIVAVAGSDEYGLAIIDLSTGEFELRRVLGSSDLLDELSQLAPAEVLVAENIEPPSGSWILTQRPEWRFDPALGEEQLCDRFKVRSIVGFGLNAADDVALLAASGVLLGYLEEVRPTGMNHLRQPRVDHGERIMHLDEMTRRNLELVEPLRPGQGMTLLSLLDRTRTPMGGRRLRRRVLRPLLDRDRIEARLDAIAELVNHPLIRDQVRTRLSPVRDLERVAARVSAGRVAPREFLGLGLSLKALPSVRLALEPVQSTRLTELRSCLDILEDVCEEIECAIDPEAPHALKDGGVIRRGYSDELDQLRDVRDNAVEFIAGMQERERKRTGIDSLKIGFNKVFGYYLEVTKSKIDKVPEAWVRKQTLTNAERYLTPELKEWEAKVLNADDNIARLESQLFQKVREGVALQVPRIQMTAVVVAKLDLVASLADVAVSESYVRPEFTDGIKFNVEAGRHPVVEATVARDTFVPNDVDLNDELRTMIVTGPNMAGKSTVLRQIGLIALMAQIGSFVPARRARIGLCDRVFTRVGASDNLTSGMSTFMMEMTETATILNGVTERSLVLLDEIGRGTSTYDGVSIAWAVTEWLNECGARTVFATHYHELVGLAESLERAGAFNVSVRENNQDIVFLHRLEPGGSDQSYGVHVARLAGLPAEVVGRASRILESLESGLGGIADGDQGKLSQLSLFRGQSKEDDDITASAGPDPAAQELLERLRSLDLNAMTPLEALNTLAEWKAYGEE